MSTFTLGISCLTTSNLPWFMDLCNIALYSIGPCFYHQSHPQLGIVFTLAPSLHSFWHYLSTDIQWHIGHLPTWGVPLSVSYHFAFSYYSWGSQGKNTEVVCHSLLQGTTFCQMVNTKFSMIIFFAAKDGEAPYSQQKQDQELTVAQIMCSLLPNSDLLKKVGENH